MKCPKCEKDIASRDVGVQCPHCKVQFTGLKEKDWLSVKMGNLKFAHVVECSIEAGECVFLTDEELHVLDEIILYEGKLVLKSKITNRF